jgi:hypothetical protein
MTVPLVQSPSHRTPLAIRYSPVSTTRLHSQPLHPAHSCPRTTLRPLKRRRTRWSHVCTGSLLVALATRPDVAFATSSLTCFGHNCSILIVQSRALGVQGEGRFLALGVSGCFRGNKSCIMKYKVEWRTKCLQRASYIQGRQVSHESIGAHYKKGSARFESKKLVYMDKIPGQTVLTGYQDTYILWGSHDGVSKQ